MTDPIPEQTYVKWEGALSRAEADAVEAHGDSLLLSKAPLAQPVDHDYSEIRSTQIAWIEYKAQSAAIYAKMSELVQTLNQRFYHFDISGLENLQYTVYHSEEHGHYDWHVDYGRHNPRPRKISISVQLSQDDSYEGCDLQFQMGNKIGTAPRSRGTLVAFPAFVLHRVTPITQGTRKSLVCWVAGPPFR